MTRPAARLLRYTSGVPESVADGMYVPPCRHRLRTPNVQGPLGLAGGGFWLRGAADFVHVFPLYEGVNSREIFFGRFSALPISPSSRSALARWRLRVGNSCAFSLIKEGLEG